MVASRPVRARAMSKEGQDRFQGIVRPGGAAVAVEAKRRELPLLEHAVDGLVHGLLEGVISARVVRREMRHVGQPQRSAAGAADATQLAESGQYDRSGRALLDVVNRLTDVLVAIRQ